jgi:hypothetical protein
MKKRSLTTRRSDQVVFMFYAKVRNKVHLYFREFAKTEVVFKCRFVFEGFARKNEG